MSKPIPIELLSPARNLQCGVEALRCGADAVYIGAKSWGARAAASNTTSDIRLLCDYAHVYGARVYVAFNTILYDSELDAARRLADELAAAGVDAFIIQDWALATMDLPLPLHASTQMDNRTPEQLHLLACSGFSRAILARELGLADIHRLHQAEPELELEAFVHGALCVSLSGRCYASQWCTGRSANRGECAQMCRLAYDLEDAAGHTVVKDKYLLSLKDMNRSQWLEDMLDAGIRSLKIEGRLKDVGYVKNTTALYRRKLDVILQRRTEYTRASRGRCNIPFEPNAMKSFNRGFTSYFLHGTKGDEDIASIHTPKSVGTPVGRAKEVKRKRLLVSGLASFSNGDGLCYFDSVGKLRGLRINKVEDNLLHLASQIEDMKPGTPLFRNHDAAFERRLAQPAPERRLAVDILLEEIPTGFRLTMTDETGLNVGTKYSDSKILAQTPQRERQKQELAKLGGTLLEARRVEIKTTEEWFLPVARMAEWRRNLVGKFLCEKRQQHPRPLRPPMQDADMPYAGPLTYEANVANAAARRFLEKHGARHVAPAYELAPPSKALLMTCAHCIRRTLGACKRTESKALRKLSEPLYLRMESGRRLRLEFNCKDCQMLVYATD